MDKLRYSDGHSALPGATILSAVFHQRSNTIPDGPSMSHVYKRINLFAFIWILAGLSIFLFSLHQYHAATMVNTAKCLLNKEPDNYPGWFSHVAQLIYRTLFETCDHNYR